MSFEQLAYKSGILGQGCSLKRYLSRPEMIRCRLPALLVLQLMDLGRWQFISASDDIYLPQEQLADRLVIEHFTDQARAHRDNLQHANTSALPVETLSQNETLATEGVATMDTRAQSTQDTLAGLGFMPLNTLIEVWWRADAQALENAVVRLQQFPDDLLKKRLARVLHSQLQTSHKNRFDEHSGDGQLPSAPRPGSGSGSGKQKE